MKTLTRWQAFEKFLFNVAFIFGIFVFIILLFRFFLFSPGRVNGPSMEPNFLDEDLFFVNKVVYFFKTPERFDVVQIVDPESKKLIIKRVIGLPGEIVQIRRGQVYIGSMDSYPNDFYVLDESEYLEDYVYTRVLGQKRAANFLVGDNQYFLLGDNRPRSGDSRVYGAVSRSHILGKVFLFKLSDR